MLIYFFFLGLLINAYYRSGSSFTGQLFNQRQNTFYIFEPLIAFGNDFCESENETSARMQYLHDAFHCRFYDQTKVAKIAGKNIEINCAASNFCFRWDMSLL